MRRLLATLAAALCCITLNAQSWTADNGNGTYTNPLFYDEFSDPDIIRVGDDFYLAGTTMHCLPGVVILHSKDLVNWEFMSYCMERFNLGDQFKLLNGKEAYGQGIWAPCIRYHNGKFYVFSNINGIGMQVFIADNPRGPWTHKNMAGNIYDLSVLFDDDGKVYAIHSYGEVKLTEIKPDFSGFVEGSTRTIIPEGNAMGEGHHAYKINGKYYILSADYAPMGRMQCARADKIEGPYETCTISQLESLGTPLVEWVDNASPGTSLPDFNYDFKISPRNGNGLGCATLHQGGIVDLPNGDWWGVSMLDFRAVGRTTCLSPITWKDGWPYFGIEGNLGRTPRTWTKPALSVEGGGLKVEGEYLPHAPYQRSGFTNPPSTLHLQPSTKNPSPSTLNPVWQWNHEPQDGKWQLKNGRLRLSTLPAKDFLWARNTLTQRCIGPVSIATVTLDARQLKDGDAAGFGLLNIPYATLGIVRQGKENTLRWMKQETHQTIDAPINGNKVYLRITCDLDADLAQFSYSTDGQTYTAIGDSVLLPYQLKTFQGARYALYAYNQNGKNGGCAEFSDFIVEEPLADRSKNIPLGKVITLQNLSNDTYMCATRHGIVHWSQQPTDDCRFLVIDKGQGRVVLKAANGTGYLTVVGEGLSADVRLLPNESDASLLMWQDMLRGQCMLLSLKTHRFIGLNPTTGEPYSAIATGAEPNRKNGTVFKFD